jgi:3'(2'), 5'-bisphosphate nucleotidase
VVASRSHFTPETAAFIDGLSERFGEVATVSAGSSVKICLVAEGTADVYPRFGPTMEWDVAAGYAVAVEAGCEVVVPDTGGRPLGFNKEVLRNPPFVVGRRAFTRLEP